MMDDTYAPGAHYLLPHDKAEFDRLNLQHEFLTKALCDGRLIFDKSIGLEENCCVLDSGTGTGIWAVDLARKVSDSVEVYAFDISDSNFMPDPPPNIKFCLASATSLPSEWTNKFDFVHQRFLLGALYAKEWRKAVVELYRVVKPGGAVQLIEADLRFPSPETPTTVQIRDAAWKGFDSLGFDYGVAGSLGKLLETVGFVNIVDELRRFPLGKSWGEIGMQGSVVTAGGIRHLFSSLAKAGVVASYDEYGSLIDRLVAEWDVHGSNYPCHVVCARKPS